MSASPIIEAVEDLRLEVKRRLVEYLEMQGVEFVRGRYFSCINPEHPVKNGRQDAHPSSNIIPGGDDTEFKCFSCKCHGDIFVAAHFLEGKPLSGPQWLTDNLCYLAKKLGIQFNERLVLSEDVRGRIDTMNVVGAAARILRSDAASKDFAIQRGWKKGTCEALGLGSITETRLSSRLMRDLDIEERDLRLPPIGKYGITSCGLFGIDFLSITLYDQCGNAVGFQARDMKFHAPVISDEGKMIAYAGPKYRNSADSPVFSKRKLLQGLHWAKASGEKECWVFEGTGSWISAWQAGLRNSVTTCGTAITPEQLTLLINSRFKVNMCLDADEAGRQAIVEAVRRSANLINILHISVVDIPRGDDPGENDADWFIQKEGIDALRALPKKPLFDWLLTQHQGSESFYEDMIEFIALDPNPISWQAKIESLATASGIAFDLVKLQVMKTAERGSQYISNKEEVIVDGAVRELRSGVSPIPILENAITELRAAGSKTTAKDDIFAIADRARDILTKLEDANAALPVWDTGWEKLNKVLDGGLPRQDCFMVIGGLPQMGKSMMVDNLVVNLCIYNPDICLYLMTIDDSWRQTLPKLIACLSEGALTIGECARPYELQDARRAEWRMHRDTVMDWISEGRLQATDHLQSDSLSYSIQMIQDLQARYPKRKLLFILDNFHKLKCPGDDERSKYKFASETYHAITSRMDITAIVTAELNKDSHGMHEISRRPRLKDLSETGKLSYDANLICMMYNEWYAKRNMQDNIRLYWEQRYDDGQMEKMPVIEADIAKNKINGVTRRMYLKADPFACWMTPVARRDVDHGRQG